MKARTQYALALVTAFAWGYSRGWGWADYATAVITIRVSFVLIGLFRTEKAGGAATIGVVAVPNQTHHTVLESGEPRTGGIDG